MTADIVPSEAILKASNRFEPDLVVVSSHGASSTRHGEHGMVTEDVVWSSPKPVLVVPAFAKRSS